MQLYSIRKCLDIPQYKVTKVISGNDQQIHLKLEPYQRKALVCSQCGQVHKKGRHGAIEVIVEDLSISGKRVYLHIVKRRVRCPVNNRIHIEEIPWLSKWSRVTKRLAEQVGRLTAITTNQEAGWFLGFDDEVVYRIDKEILAEKAKQLLEPPPSATNISIDEVSYRKYYRYLTNVIDTDRRLIIWNRQGRKAEVLDKYYQGIGPDNCQKIESVALDGARTYISSTSKYAVQALIVYDKFHIMQKLNNTVDTVRKQELDNARQTHNQELVELINCRQRFVLLKNKSRLSDKQADHLKKLCTLNEPIYKAMLLKESFLQIYNYEKIEDAEACLKSWIIEAQASAISAFQDLAASFSAKMQYILNWFKKRISSSISEGFNNKIKRLKAMAYGYKDIDYFLLKIHQHCGLLNPKLVH
jgi:transposase